MSIETYLAFVVASTIILVIPGPTIILVISQAIGNGRGSVTPLVLGVLAGDFTAMFCSLMGLGALLKLSAELFTIFKLVGAIYLLYLGIRQWMKSGNDGNGTGTPAGGSFRSLFWDSFVVTSLNPKSIAFFVAFLPQFINPASGTALQLVSLGTTFLVLAGINAAIYAIFAGQLRERIGKPEVRKWFDRAGGTALIGAGLITAAMRHSR